MHIFNAGGSARWGPVPFMKKTASLESGNAATVGAGLRHVFGSVGEQEKLYLRVMTCTVGKKCPENWSAFRAG